jgi:hypothetical protein
MVVAARPAERRRRWRDRLRDGGGGGLGWDSDVWAQDIMVGKEVSGGRAFMASAPPEAAEADGVGRQGKNIAENLLYLMCTSWGRKAWQGQVRLEEKKAKRTVHFPLRNGMAGNFLQLPWTQRSGIWG